MAQALPRFCPRCSTPTRANMRVCPTCGLPVEAMLSRPSNTLSGNSNFTSQEAPQEQARSMPYSTQPGENQPYRPQAAPASSRSTLEQPQTPEETYTTQNSQNASTGAPDVEDWPTQNEALVPPANSKNPGSSPGIEDWPTQNEALVSPVRPKNPDSLPGIEDWPTQNPAFVPPARPKNSLSPPGAEAQNVQNPVPPAGSRNPGSSSGTEDWRTQVAPPMPQEQSPAQAPWSAQQSSPGPQSPWAQPAPPAPEPSYTPAPQPKRQRRTGLIIVLLVILLVLGGGGYLASSMLGVHVPGLGPSQSTIKTTRLNLVTNYAGIDITILSVEQAQNFLDDPQSASDGMLRLNLQEQNQTKAAINWNYTTSARLIAPGVTPIAPVYVQSKTAIAPGATEKSLIDFPIADGGTLSKLIFQLGAANEAQIQIPLTTQANLDKYKPQTSQQNGTMLYFGLSWTLTSATTSLSIPGQQASSGMEFLVLTLKVDNTLSQTAITGSPFDYIEVKAGDQTATPIDSTLPVSFASGEMGKTGTVTLLIPQNSSSCTLILLSQDPGTSGQASTDFQVG